MRGRAFSAGGRCEKLCSGYGSAMSSESIAGERNALELPELPHRVPGSDRCPQRGPPQLESKERARERH
jgi:hypothetical protein